MMTNIKITYQILFAIILSLFFYSITFNSYAASHSMSDNGKHISYTDIGHGDPVVFIHAFPTDQRLWQPQREGLKNHFRVITLDLWGFGKSASVDGQAVTMTEYADEVKQLFDQLHIQKAIIGGESMGGYIALAFLQKYPDQVKGLILSDTQCIADSEETKAKREATAQDVLEHGTTQVINGFMPKALTKEASEQLQQVLRNILESQAAKAVASASRGMALRSDTTSVLSNTQLPVLIIAGEQDALINPQQSKSMHELAKNSELVVIENAAHLSSFEQPEKWNQAVIKMFYKS